MIKKMTTDYKAKPVIFECKDYKTNCNSTVKDINWDYLLDSFQKQEKDSLINTAIDDKTMDYEVDKIIKEGKETNYLFNFERIIPFLKLMFKNPPTHIIRDNKPVKFFFSIKSSMPYEYETYSLDSGVDHILRLGTKYFMEFYAGGYGNGFIFKQTTPDYVQKLWCHLFKDHIKGGYHGPGIPQLSTYPTMLKPSYNSKSKDNTHLHKYSSISNDLFKMLEHPPEAVIHFTKSGPLLDNFILKIKKYRKPRNKKYKKYDSAEGVIYANEKLRVLETEIKFLNKQQELDLGLGEFKDYEEINDEKTDVYKLEWNGESWSIYQNDEFISDNLDDAKILLFSLKFKKFEIRLDTPNDTITSSQLLHNEGAPIEIFNLWTYHLRSPNLILIHPGDEYKFGSLYH